MTIEKPLWMQNLTFAARLDRALADMVWTEGTLTGFVVSQRGAGANMTVDVSAGRCIVQGDDQTDQGKYLGASTAVENVTGFVATGANQRIDLVVARINDPNAGGAAGNTLTLERVAGTQSASPVAPAAPASALILATVGPFTTSTSSITNSMITNMAPALVRMPFLTAQGDMIVATAAGLPARLAKGTTGQVPVAGATTVAWGQADTAGIADNAVTAAKIAADAVGSSEIAANAVGTAEIIDATVTTAKIASEQWVDFSPSLVQFVSVSKTDTYCRYIKFGRFVEVQMSLACTSAGGAGSTILVGMPFAAAGFVANLPMGAGHLRDTSGTDIYDFDVTMATSTTFALKVPTLGSSDYTFLGTTGSVFAGALASGDTILCSFRYEAAT